MTPMATVPNKYQASTRLIDDPDQLERLYCEQELTVRKIADKYASVGRTMVSNALDEYNITGESCDCMRNQQVRESERGTDPPTSASQDVDWSLVT